MKPFNDPHTIYSDIYAGFFDRLNAIYAAMDRAYDKTARHYRFHCTGCDDTCCLTRFYHHTYLEYGYLMKGMHALDDHVQVTVRKKARETALAMDEAEDKGGHVRCMCPLNDNGKCILYDFRPMICRLHVIPHILRPPHQPPKTGPGCAVFERRCGTPKQVLLDCA